jgi:hypothetical protein
MDPKAALRNFLEAVAQQDRNQAREALEDLMRWHDAGGFLLSKDDLTEVCSEFSEPRWVDRPR